MAVTDYGNMSTDELIGELVGPVQEASMDGAYDAANRFDQNLLSWQPAIMSPDMEVLPGKMTMDARSRDLVRNDGSVQNGANVHKDGIVGSMYLVNAKPEQIFMWLGVRGEDDLTLEHIPLMRGGYAALRDGSSTVEEMFDPRRMTAKGGFEAINNPLADDLEEDDDSVPERTAPTRATPAPSTSKPQAASAPQADNDDGAPFDIDDDNENPAPRQARPAAANTNAPTSTEGATAPKRRGRPPRAATQEAQEEGSAEQGQSTGATAKPAQDAPAEAQPLDPRSTEQYVDYWRTVMAAATNATALEERWKSPRERALRGNCSVIEDDLVSLRTEQNARLAQLRGES